jgi:hypothetical protein
VTVISRFPVDRSHLQQAVCIAAGCGRTKPSGYMRTAAHFCPWITFPIFICATLHNRLATAPVYMHFNALGALKKSKGACSIEIF